MVMPYKNTIVKIAGFTMIVGFAMFVWPTPYRYAKLTLSGGGTYIVSFNRFTNNADRFSTREGYWVSYKRATSEIPANLEAPVPMPAPAPQDVTDEYRKKTTVKP